MMNLQNTSPFMVWMVFHWGTAQGALAFLSLIMASGMCGTYGATMARLGLIERLLMGNVLSGSRLGSHKRTINNSEFQNGKASLRKKYFQNGKASLRKKYSFNPDIYTSCEQITVALREAGLESCNLIIGIDFTSSNEWTGKRSFNGKSLHETGNIMNPYEQVISIIGRTLAPLDEDGKIPCFGFGDVTTHDSDVFSFYHNNEPCNGLEQVLTRYKQLIPHVTLSGPTSFAPVIEVAMDIVKDSGGLFHILVIIADGQVGSGSSFANPQEEKTIKAIVEASAYPLAIVIVGVGDGPWDMMRKFDDKLPKRAFDNFQFVDFMSIMSKRSPESRKEAEFALMALMEIPAQYKAALELGLLGHCPERRFYRFPRPPPLPTHLDNLTPSISCTRDVQTETGSHPPLPLATTDNSTPSISCSRDPQAEIDSVSEPATDTCPVCLDKPKDLAFNCGHMSCRDCGSALSSCPICRAEIHSRLRLFPG